MTLFTFLTTGKSHSAPNALARLLTKNEKLAVRAVMHLVVNRHGKRQVYGAETCYIQAISQRVLKLAQTELAAPGVADLDPFWLLSAMSQANRRYVAGVMYGLAMVVQDPAVIGRASVVIRELGFSMTDLAYPSRRKPAHTTRSLIGLSGLLGGSVQLLATLWRGRASLIN